MIRILLDEHGAYTKDLFVKIDGTPSCVFIADTTWLSEFFNTNEVDASEWSDEQQIAERKADVALLIQFWQKLLLSDQHTCYLPFDLADQSSSALRITKGKKLYQINAVWTTDIVDGTSEAYFLKHHGDIIWQVRPAEEWALAPASIFTGLEWSLARLELPSIPLRYD